jgi:hypothetical protein
MQSGIASVPITTPNIVTKTGAPKKKLRFKNKLLSAETCIHLLQRCMNQGLKTDARFVVIGRISFQQPDFKAW